MKYVRTVEKDPDPKQMPERALICAIKACQDSKFGSDRLFAKECAEELERRAAGERADMAPAQPEAAWA